MFSLEMRGYGAAMRDAIAVVTAGDRQQALASLVCQPYVVPPPLLVTRYSASFLKATDLIAPIRTSRMAYGPFWHSLIYNALGSQPGARPAATQKNAGVKAVRAGGRCGMLFSGCELS